MAPLPPILHRVVGLRPMPGWPSGAPTGAGADPNPNPVAIAILARDVVIGRMRRVAPSCAAVYAKIEGKDEEKNEDLPKKKKKKIEYDQYMYGRIISNPNDAVEVIDLCDVPGELSEHVEDEGFLPIFVADSDGTIYIAKAQNGKLQIK